ANRSAITAYCRGTITSCRSGQGGGVTYLAHSRCKRPLESREGVLWCDFCQQWTEHNEFAFSVRCVMDDGTAECGVEMGVVVADDLLGISAAELHKLKAGVQQEVLRGAIGIEVECCISRVDDLKHNSTYWRIDALQMTSSRIHDILDLCAELM
ncbi:hypothetical protein HDV00_011344, partial [Rhizophlyctis rosea]